MVKVFSTVIMCVKNFASDFPDNEIFFRGNTEQKNKVYSEILRRHYEEFSIDFNIFGISVTGGNSSVEKFDVEKSYSGFYLSVKK